MKEVQICQYISYLVVDYIFFGVDISCSSLFLFHNSSNLIAIHILVLCLLQSSTNMNCKTDTTGNSARTYFSLPFLGIVVLSNLLAYYVFSFSVSSDGFFYIFPLLQALSANKRNRYQRQKSLMLLEMESQHAKALTPFTPQ